MSKQAYEKTFSIVEFAVDNTVEIIPSFWISEDHQSCKFPCPIPKGFLKVQSNIDSPIDPKWTEYEIKLVKSYSKLSIH